jgi:1-deoxy-D-xylulose-5-phosphate reductoisomerase
MKRSGNMPCILNAANEIAVAAFLRDEIGFLEMSNLIEDCMKRISFIEHPSLEDYELTDKETRIMALQHLQSRTAASVSI